MKTSTLSLPVDLQGDQTSFLAYLAADDINIDVGDGYLARGGNWTGVPEVICIQRLITLVAGRSNVHVYWEKNAAQAVFGSPCIFPLLTVLLCLDNVVHLPAEEQFVLDVAAARKAIYEYRLKADLFSDIQILLCADNRGRGRPRSLYSSAGLIPRDEFETIIDVLLSTHTGYGIGDSKAIFFIKAVGTIVAELFENTELHGRVGLDGKLIKENGVRGLIFKRVKIHKNGDWRKLNDNDDVAIAKPSRERKISMDALEISVFDAGVGFYSSYTRQPLDEEVLVNDEWDVVHKCLERHYDNRARDSGLSHRAMGLYEVLRALQLVTGVLEVRSGRTYGYRSFVQGEMRFQIEPLSSLSRPNMPKPVLLDHDRQFVTAPSTQERLIGASIRVLIPLL
jgi:hypothetical protein